MTEPVMAFTIDVAARLTGLSERQLRRLDVDGLFAPSFALPNRRRPYSRSYSLDDLVMLRIAAMLRERGVAWNRIAEAINRLRPVVGEPRDAAVFVADKRIAFGDEELEASGPIETIGLAAVRDELCQQIQSLEQRTTSQIGKTHRDPSIQGGEEVFAGTRIRLATIQSLLRAGTSEATILGEFPRLTRADIAYARRTLDVPRQLAS